MLLCELCENVNVVVCVGAVVFLVVKLYSMEFTIRSAKSLALNGNFYDELRKCCTFFFWFVEFAALHPTELATHQSVCCMPCSIVREKRSLSEWARRRWHRNTNAHTQLAQTRPNKSFRIYARSRIGITTDSQILALLICLTNNTSNYKVICAPFWGIWRAHKIVRTNHLTAVDNARNARSGGRT